MKQSCARSNDLPESTILKRYLNEVDLSALAVRMRNNKWPMTTSKLCDDWLTNAPRLPLTIVGGKPLEHKHTSVSAGSKQSIDDHRAAWTYVNVRINYVTSVRVGARVWSTGADRDSAVCLAACRANVLSCQHRVTVPESVSSRVYYAHIGVSICTLLEFGYEDRCLTDRHPTT